MAPLDPKQRYADADDKRLQHVDAIVGSPAQKKIVVAGPGTGKTFLFKAVLRGKESGLTLSFVNSLVEDLSLELYGLSEVKTLHSFARGLVGKAFGSAKVFPKLSHVIREDARIVLDQDTDFDKMFHERDDKNEGVKFYSERRKYYDRYYGHTDIIFAAVLYLEQHREKIPKYDQVLVDEFQDFNRLEVSFIDLLSSAGPILLAGDDDQALYDFKNASAEHIRARYSEDNGEYVSFTLPYCSRCTRVIIDAINDVISGAVREGHLKGRIAKDYRYFDCETKDKDSSRYPKIVYGQRFARQIPWFIETEIEKIALEEKEKFSVLVISPTGLQSRTIAEALREKSFENIIGSDRRDTGLSMLDGLRLLIEEVDSNLGWRIVTSFMASKKELEALVRASVGSDAKRFREMVNDDVRAKVQGMLKTLRKINKDESVDGLAMEAVCSAIGIDPHAAIRQVVRERLAEGGRTGNPAIRKIPIQTTTIQSSKGLAEDYVFITHLDDRYLIRDGTKMSDREICNFLVALTRARKRVFLISSNPKEPTFLKWIARERIETV
jgi:ATP-dependent DNA helicase UvrD/PcrA